MAHQPTSTAALHVVDDAYEPPAIPAGADPALTIARLQRQLHAAERLADTFMWSWWDLDSVRKQYAALCAREETGQNIDEAAETITELPARRHLQLVR